MQIVCVKSNAQVEYRAAAMRVAKLLWLKILLKDIEIQIKEPMKLYYDNKTAINLINGHVFHDRMKHMRSIATFIREKINTEEEPVSPYVKFMDQLTDMFTRWLFTIEFERNVSKLDMIYIYIFQLKETCGGPGYGAI